MAAESVIAGSFKLNQLQPWLREYAKMAINALDSLGVTGTIYDVYRSPEEQERRFAAGDTAAHAGQSAHNFGLAFDFVVSEGEDSQRQRQAQLFWKWLGFGVLEKPILYRKDGSPVYDRAHVEFPNWRALLGR